jgi:formate dehydrogenase major subunit
MKLMNKLDYKCHYDKAEDIYNEMRTVTPQYAGITYARIAENNGLVWPCPDLEHRGTPILHGAGPSPAKGKFDFKAVEWTPSSEMNKADYPVLMTTNRLQHQYHTRSMTGKTPAINEYYPDHYIMINPADAKTWGIADGETVKVTSPRASIQTCALITDKVKAGTAAMPFHWPEANMLTNADELDPLCRIPGLKVTGVKIEKS